MADADLSRSREPSSEEEGGLSSGEEEDKGVETPLLEREQQHAGMVHAAGIKPHSKPAQQLLAARCDQTH